MLRYFYGDDTFTARRRIEALAKEGQAHIRFVDASDTQTSSLESIIDNAKGSLFEKTFLVLRDPQDYSDSLKDELIQLLKHDTTKTDVTIWICANPDARTVLHKTLIATCESSTFPIAQEDAQARAWINEYCPGIEQDAVGALLGRVGFEPWALASELDKLTAYHSPITREDVEKVVPDRSSESQSVFILLNAIVGKQTKTAMRLLQGMIDDGASERFIVSMLAYQFRLFLSIRIGIDKNQAVALIAKQSKLHPVAVQKAMPMARRMSIGGIHDALLRIMGTERSMNTKTMDPRSIVTMLVLSLSTPSRSQ